MIVLMAGLPGTGKTTLANALATRTGGRIIGKDEIRHSLFHADEIEYSTRQDDLCLQIMLRLAGFLLEKDRERMIFLDGRTFSRGYQIENVISAAEALHQPWRILECVCSEETARQRLEHDAAAGVHRARNRTFALYLEMKAVFEAIVLAKTVLDTDQTLAACVELAMAALQ
jgi:predicted kinase